MIPYPPAAALATPGLVTIGPQTFGGAKTFDAAPIISTLTANAVLVSSSSKQVSSQALTNGQLLIGSTSAAPVAAALTGTSNQITVTGGAGSITLSLPQNINTNSSPTFSSTTLGGALNLIGASGNVVVNMQPSDAYTVQQYHDWAIQPIYDSSNNRTAVAAIRFKRPSTTSGNYDGQIEFMSRNTGSALTTGITLEKDQATRLNGKLKFGANDYFIIEAASGAGGVKLRSNTAYSVETYLTGYGWFHAYDGITPNIGWDPNSTGMVIASTWGIKWRNTTNARTGTTDLILNRAAAASLQLGADAASAVTQTLKAHDGTGTNIAGAKICIATGRGTGSSTAATGALQATTAGSSGTTLQTLRDVLQWDGNTTTDQTCLLVLDLSSGTMKRVKLGANDSGGTGLKVLCLDN